MHLSVCVLLPVAFVTTDLLLTVLAFGFYPTPGQPHPSPFSITSLGRNLFPFSGPDGYTFTDSPFEFLLFALLRTIFSVGVLLSRWKRMVDRPQPHTSTQTTAPSHWPVNFSRVMVSLELVNFTYTVLKLLAFSEHQPTDLLPYAGVWTNCVWNVVGLFLMHAMLEYIRKYTPDSYETLVNEAPEREVVVESGNGTVHAGATGGERAGESPAEGSGESKEPEPESITNASTLKHIILLLKYSSIYWQWLCAGFAFLVIYSVARTFTPLYTARVVDNIVTGEESSVFLQSILTMAGLTAVATVFAGLRGGCFSYAGALVSTRIRRDVFAAISRQEIGFFDSTQTGEIISRLTSDCEAMTDSISLNINVFMRNALMIAGSFGFMAMLSWRLTLVTVALSPTIGYFVKLYSVYYDQLAERTQNRIAEATRSAEEVISSMRTVRSFACERQERARYNGRLEEVLSVLRYESLTYGAFTIFNELAYSVVLIVVLLYGGHLVLVGRMTKVDIVAFLLYQMQLADNFSTINYGLTGLMKSVGASRKIFQYLQRQPKIDLDAGHITQHVSIASENGGGAIIPRPLGSQPTITTEGRGMSGEVEFRSVTFSYPTRLDTEVLHSISFKIHAGETVALVGPSGSGKSSIVSLIERFYEPLQGEILLDGVLISDYEHSHYHRRVALVAQEPVLYSGSVRYNILYGCGGDGDNGSDGAGGGRIGEEEMLEAAKLANIHDFIMESKQKYDTRCGEKGVLMSGGQKQRIAIARALVRKPAVLILDEATSALDSESEHLIQEALKKCSVGRTVLVIAHRLSTVERADRILVIEKGRLVQSGTHGELMQQRDGLYYSLVQRQLKSRDGEGDEEEG